MIETRRDMRILRGTYDEVTLKSYYEHLNLDDYYLDRDQIPVGPDGTQDLEQEARLALYRAAQTYNRSQKNVSFGLYAKVCIHNSLVSTLRKCTARERSVKRSLPPVPAAREEDPLILAAAAEASGRLSGRIAQVLSPYEQTVFDLYISGRSVKYISSSVGKTEKSVYNAVYRIRVKIKGLLEN